MNDNKNNVNKKIALITWLGGGNFGTSLQSFALHRILQDLGYSVTFLSGCPKRFTIKNKIKRTLGLFGIDLTSIKKIFKKKELSAKQRKLQGFIKDNYNLAEPINSKKQLDKLVNNTDVFVTGSDQIWNTVFNFNPFFFLDFAKDKKRIAYASSMGITDFPDEHKPKVKSLLSKFQHIGVREQTAVKAISTLLGRNDVQQVLDPTFLLTADDWTRMTNGNEIEIELPDHFILCYLIGSNSWYKEQIQVVKTVYGIQKVIIIPAIENKDINIPEAMVYSDAGPKEFVRLIEQSSLVCTDSFHATALSINLKKEFVEFMRFKDKDEESQNSRIYDVLERYRLMYKIYDSNNNDWSKKIDYTTINRMLEDDRKRSLEFLIKSIES